MTSRGRDRAARLAVGRLEVRRMGGSVVECREAGDRLTFSGLASATNTPYDMGGYTEIVRSGAFATTLAADPDVQLLVAHCGMPIARTVNGSLRLSESSRGLEFQATAPTDDPDAVAVARKVKAGLISEASFAFRVVRQEWDDDYDERRFLEVDLHRGDVSICALGANPATSVSARAAGRGQRPNLDFYRARAWALRARARATR